MEKFINQKISNKCFMLYRRSNRIESQTLNLFFPLQIHQLRQ